MATVTWSLQHKRDTAANWTANNPTLLAGQFGFETDTNKLKIGTGVAWNSTSYFQTSYTASNGLTLNGSVFELGGTLTKNTTISLNGFDFGIIVGNSGATPLPTASFYIESNTTNYLSFVQPDANIGGIVWQSPSDGNTGWGAFTQFTYTTGIMEIGTSIASGGEVRIYHGNATLNSVFSSTGFRTNGGVITALGLATSGILRAENSSTGVGIGGGFGSLEFYSNDSSSNANGVRAKIQSLAEATAGAAGMTFFTTTNGSTTLNQRMLVSANGNVVIGSTAAALATTATNGFLYVPACAGVPTGVPTAYTGSIPVIVDSTNNRMYIYSGGAWVALN